MRLAEALRQSLVRPWRVGSLSRYQKTPAFSPDEPEDNWFLVTPSSLSQV
jgi:hypothetical protein